MTSKNVWVFITHRNLLEYSPQEVEKQEPLGQWKTGSLHGGRQHYGTDRTRVESDSCMSKVQLDAARSDKVRQQATCRRGKEGGKVKEGKGSCPYKAGAGRFIYRETRGERGKRNP